MIIPLPNQLVYNEILPVEENNLIEFKGIQDVKRFPDVIGRYSREYLNAFLNSHGGQLWFGIEDDSRVKGILTDSKIRDSIRLSIDAAVAQFIPQVDADLSEVHFINVTLPDDYESEIYTLSRIKPWELVNKESQEIFQMVVIVATIHPGTAPVYFTTKQHEAAFFRRDGGITKMTTDTIVQRMQEGRPFFSQKAINNELSFNIRKDIIAQCIQFLANDEPPTKLIILFGLVSVGKSKLAEHLKQIIISDKAQFPIQRKAFQANLKGVNEKFKKIDDILVQLIRSMKPEQDLTFVNKQLVSHLLNPSEHAKNNISAIMKEGIIDQKENISTNTEILLNIFKNVAAETSPFVLILENVGNCQYIEQIIPAGIDCYIILTSRSQLQLEYQGPAVNSLELSVPPLSEDEGAILVIGQLGVSLEEGREISRLCAGLPQVLRLVCQNSKLYGVQPLQTLRSLGHSTVRLEKLSPGLGKLLSGLSQTQCHVLSTLSIFPGMFSEDASFYILDVHSLFQNESADQNEFISLVQLGIIDKIQPPCIGLRQLNWFHITQAIREYIFQSANKIDVMDIMKKYVTYFTILAIQLNNDFRQQPNSGKKHASTLFKKVTEQQIKNGVNDMFLTYSKSFYVCLQILVYMINDPRQDIYNFACTKSISLLSNINIFSHYFTSNIIDKIEQVNDGVLNRTIDTRYSLIDADLDFSIWECIFC
ncbi:AAA-4 domain protein [Spironucleus salmonicida]|uniref:AAA-4 domain protein n=1 Tax=Spironucleus salmonicida TaxID=348837 RepID=V6LKY6_9EUKA|nr:AAA-4 domain protein [Spironucleus salmonicida]|eukprot:EST45028.1 AAA-4 domain protein [Spironucleus salmonicida]